MKRASSAADVFCTRAPRCASIGSTRSSITPSVRCLIFPSSRISSRTSSIRPAPQDSPKGVAITHWGLSRHLDELRRALPDHRTRSHAAFVDHQLRRRAPRVPAGADRRRAGADAWPQAWTLESSRARCANTRSRSRESRPRSGSGCMLLEDLPHLRQITVGGEALPGDALARWLEGREADPRRQSVRTDRDHGGVRLAQPCGPADASQHTVPIGLPYASRAAW